MQVATKGDRTIVTFDEADERVAWQITAARQQRGDATLKNELLKTVEEMSRLFLMLGTEGVAVRRPSEMWNFKLSDDGRLVAEISKS